MDEARNRYLRDRVMTASPAQRVVMLFDRLSLDLARAGEDATAAGTHLDHATQVVAELLGSLDLTAGGPAENLSSLYSFLLAELVAVRGSGDSERIAAIEPIVSGLREAFAAAAASLAATAATSAGTNLAFAASSAGSTARAASAWVS